MAKDPVPEKVRNFISDHIDSVAELEALLLMRRERGTAWGAALLAERLYIGEGQVAQVLAKLCSLGLVVDEGETGAFRYEPAPQELTDLIGDVAEAYSRYLIPVTNLIHSKPQPRVQQFADAFKFDRRDE